MTDNIKKFLELINENPELPIVCMVDSDIIGDDYGRWMAQIGWSEVGEFASYNERFYTDREEFTEDYYNSNDVILDERFGYNPLMPSLYTSIHRMRSGRLKMKTFELKPCPFCGGDALLIEHPYDPRFNTYGVECTKCQVSTATNYCYPTSAIEAWNRRAKDV